MPRLKEDVEPHAEETRLDSLTPPPTSEIDPSLQETPTGMDVRVPAWRVWLDSVAARFKITVNRPKVREDVELESNVQDFNPLPAEVNEAALSSEEIFSEIGGQLRKRREMLSLTHDEIERHTRVRAQFLKALEDGMLENLPSPVQTRGVLANYANFLDLDVDTILLRFADGLQARYRERQGQKPARTRAPMMVNTSLPFWRVLMTTDLLFGGGMALMLVIFAIWGISFVVSIQSSAQPQATAPSIADVLGSGTPIATSLQEVTLIPVQNTPLAAPQDTTATVEVPTLSANITVQLILVATERTYLRVTVDGKVKFDGRVEPGSAYPFDAEKQIDILVGNAAALKVTFNGRDLGLMGSFGEVIDRVYTAQGVATPTGTPPPTFTPTPYITPTPSLTPTRTPSSTPTLKAGG